MQWINIRNYVVQTTLIGGEETIIAHRKIATNRLAIDCIHALSKDEPSMVDRELEGIVSNVPRKECGIKR